MLSHVCLLCRSVDRAAARLAAAGLPVGPRDEFDGEGTAEVYVGGEDSTARLLLVEPVKPGPYASALARRGPGLHHIAIEVADLEAFVSGLAGTGWYLHPASLRSVRAARTAWLARPGVALLVEVHERSEPLAGPPFITRLEVPLPERERRMVAALPAPQVQPSEEAAGPALLVLGGLRMEIPELL